MSPHSTLLPIQVREHVFGLPARPQLSLAMDVCTRSLVGSGSLVSDTGLDIAMLLRDVMTPARMRRGWDDTMRWAYPGVPVEVVDEAAGYPVASRPFPLFLAAAGTVGSPPS